MNEAEISRNSCFVVLNFKQAKQGKQEALFVLTERLDGDLCQ
jgi:hypothetical protein